MKAVMYHYVRHHRADLPAFRYLDAEDFGHQLDHFVADGGVIGRDELLAAIESGRPADGYVLTFDDGLRDHAEIVTPMLAERGLFGLFYVSTGPLTNGSVLDVHRIHLLLGRLGADRLLAAVEAKVTTAMVDGDPLRWRDRYAHQGDDAAATVKRTLNYMLTPAARSTVLDDLVHEEWGQPLCVADVYATGDQLRHMVDAGMLIGSHSVSHQVMARLDPAEQAREITESFHRLEATVGAQPVRSWCHPYGGDSTFDHHTESALDAAGVRFSFSVDAREVTPRDLLERRHALPRFDCNQFPHGRSSGG